MIDIKRTKINIGRMGGEEIDLALEYLSIAKSQGFKLMGGNSIGQVIKFMHSDVGCYYWLMCDDDSLFGRGEYEYESSCVSGDLKEYKELYIEDLKPKTRTEVVYEEVNGMDHLSDYFLVHESDGLYCFCPTDGEYKLLTNGGVLRSFDLIKPVYRKVEKEIDWVGKLDAFLNDNNIHSSERISMIERNKFIEMCHLVESLTDKPE